MRPSRLVFVFLVGSLAALAADLNVKVVDPRSSAVTDARVVLYRSAGTQPLGLRNSSSEGVATFSGLDPGGYRLEVLAPGFAFQKTAVRVPEQGSITVQLAVAGLAQTVVVAATRSPISLEDSGASEALLEQPALENLQPIAASDALRFLPGAVINTAGQRGGLASLFVRGGESRYNKVLVDGVPVNEPGGVFNFGVVPPAGFDRMEFVRGAESVLYGSDAMTSVVQFWSQTGHTRTPEIRFGADGGTFGTARGYALLAGVIRRFDYALFGSQDATAGQGPNADYSNTLEGANLGAALSPNASLRLRVRHANSRTGVPNEWNYNGQALLAPDTDGFARQNDLIASTELAVTAPARWQHRFTGFEYHHKRLNQDRPLPPAVPDRGCDFVSVFTDCPFAETFDANRAGLEYQGDYSPRNWAHSTFGYQFEEETGLSDVVSFDLSGNVMGPPSHTHGLRRNHAVYGEQTLIWKRISAVGGVRYIHNENFGDKAVPRVAFSVLALRGGDLFSGTRLRFAYAEGIQACTFEECFGITGIFRTDPNPNLKPERNRSFEAGAQQGLLTGKASLSAIYFNNLFRDQIAFQTINFVTFEGEFFNLNKSLAHGAEVEFHARLRPSVELQSAYTYTSSQVLVAPGAFSPLLQAGAPLLRRPKHAGSLLLNYYGKRWGGDVAGSFVGRRSDFDSFGFGIDHAAGYALLNTGGWFAVNRYVTAYVNLENILNRRYQEVVGYPALKANFRAGMRFRIGGDQ